ncbi:MAG: hypothetical protein ACW981_05980 [Candidatus Hodarchaeales archaeon]
MSIQYKFVQGKWNTTSPEVEIILNENGRNGWELNNVLLGTSSNQEMAKIHGFIFQRRVNESKSEDNSSSSTNLKPFGKGVCQSCGSVLNSYFDKFCSNCGLEVKK